MKTITCPDCGETVKLKPKGHNRERCDPCGAIRKLEIDSNRSYKKNKENPGCSNWYRPYSERETIEDKVEKILDTFTWPMLQFPETPFLDAIVLRNDG